MWFFAVGELFQQSLSSGGVQIPLTIPHLENSISAFSIFHPLIHFHSRACGSFKPPQATNPNNTQERSEKMQNTLVYIKLNRISALSEDELLMGGKNTLLFLPISSKVNEEEAIRTIKLFSEDCQKTCFHVIAETVFIGSAEETARFLKKIVCKIRYLDCVVLPSIACFDEDPETLAEVIEFMASEGVLVYKPNKERLKELRCAYSGISI